MRIQGYRTRLTTGILERTRIPRRFWETKYDNVPESVHGYLGNYLRALDEMVDGGEGLLLWGPNGVGKTSVAALVAFELSRRGGTAYFVTAESLRIASIEKTWFDDETTVMERAQEVELLIIDDLGKEHRSESAYAERLIENLLRVRLANKRSTIITTNLPLVGNREKRVAGLNTVYSTSMLEVLREATLPLEVTGKNQRLTAAAHLQERLAV